MSSPDPTPKATPEAGPYTLAALAALIAVVNNQLHRDAYEVCREQLAITDAESIAKMRAHQEECPICRARRRLPAIFNAMSEHAPAADTGDAEAYAKAIHALRIYVYQLSFLTHTVATHHEAAIVRQHDGSKKKCHTCINLGAVWGLLAAVRRLIAAHQGKPFFPGQLVASIRPAIKEELNYLDFERDAFLGYPAVTSLADGTVLLPMADFDGNAYGVQWAIMPDGEVLGLYQRDGKIDTRSVLVSVDGEASEDIGDPQDYVVAVDAATGKAFEAWPGEAYRDYDDSKTHQYQVSMANGPDDAKQRAEAIHAQFNRATEGK